MLLRFGAGIFRPVSSYAINDFESLPLGAITTLPGEITYGGVHFETATFAPR